MKCNFQERPWSEETQRCAGAVALVDGVRIKQVWFADEEEGVVKSYDIHQDGSRLRAVDSVCRGSFPPEMEIEMPDRGVVSRTFRGVVKILLAPEARASQMAEALRCPRCGRPAIQGSFCVCIPQEEVDQRRSRLQDLMEGKMIATVVVEKVANTRYPIEVPAESATQDDSPEQVHFAQEVVCVEPLGARRRILLTYQVTDPAQLDEFRPGDVLTITLDRR